MRKFYPFALLLLLSFAGKAQFPMPYCAEAFPSGVEPITSVVFNTINNTSSATLGGTAHENFTAISTTVQRGATYTIQVKGNTGGDFQDGVRAFFDFNNNNVFTDAGEAFNVGVLANSTGTDAVVVTTSITIPTTSVIGSIRMRISKKYNTYAAPCSTTGFGQAEDYTINITAPACALPSNLQFSSVSVPNAMITWTAATGVTSYEYAITTSPTPPANGTVTSATTGSATGLPAATALFAYVRSVCSAGVYTEWVRKAFVPCTSNITPASGAMNVAVPTTFNWAPIAGVSNYQILLSTDNGVTYPLSGVFGAPPATNIGGLAYSTTYKWYVRGIIGSDTAATSCAANATSFTTQAAPTPPSNDSCGAPVTLTPGITVNASTLSATQSLPPSACGGSTSDGAYDIWYKITTLSSGTFTVSVTGTSPFDAVLGIYHGTCSSLVLDTCRDNTGSGGTETITFSSAVPGSVYLIRVYSWYISDFTDSTGAFSITATGPALPVTGVMLSGIRNGSKTQLNWKTLTETNNAGFELQRSADGQSFTGIANIASKATGGNSAAAINYSFDDVKPFSAANYYRLKQTDKDGKISYSNIVYLKGVAVSNLTLSALYPNPTRNILKAAVLSPAAESITFIITDMMGKVISRQVSNVISGDNIVSLNVTNLPSGSYLLKAVCRNGCETTYQKFTKQ